MTEAAQILEQTKPAADIPKQDMGEAPKEGTAPATNQPGEKLSSKLDILMRREAQLLARDRAIKEKETEFESKYSSKVKRLEEFDTVKTDPKKALEYLGLTYDELTQSLLKDGEVPPSVEIRKLKEELESLKKNTKDQFDSEHQLREKELKRQQEAKEQEVTTSFKSEIKQYVEDNKTRYELIGFESGQDLVFEVIEEHYNRTIDPETGSGKVMPIAEAADKVEQYLEEKYYKSRELSKVKTLWGSLPKATQEKVIKQELAKSQPPKTLTNNLSATSTPRKTPLNDEERIQKAISYAQSLRR